MDAQTLMEYQWPYLLACLPAQCELEESARRFNAITRRREIGTASTLLRLALAYGFCNLSLRQTAAWAEAAQVALISNVALLKRLRKAAPWLGYLLAAKLADNAPPFQFEQRRLRLRLLDATAISCPGNTGTDFRLHLGYDLQRQAIDSAEVTDVRGGETLTRFSFSAGELVLADRGYSHRRGLYAVVQAGADFLVRHNWQLLPLLTPEGGKFDVLAAMRELPEAQAASFDVLVTTAGKNSPQPHAARLIAARKSEAAADETRCKMLRRRTRQQQHADPRALEMAGYLCLLTSLPSSTLSPEGALELYRYRWQVELAFKRLKGLIELGKLPAKDPALARTIIYAKLLAALVLNDYTSTFLGFFPWGYRLAQPSAFAVAD